MRNALNFALLLVWLFPAFARGEEFIAKPHLDQEPGSRSVALHGRTFVNQGLVGTGQLSADTVDFLGDTLGSFSSLKIARDTWKRVGDHFEGTLWTLPDRGNNDPAAKIFFDYPTRLERLRARFAPIDGKLDLTPDGGIKLLDFRGQPFTGADPGAGTLTELGMVLPAPAGGIGAGKVSIDAEALQFTRNGGFYVGDEYAANVYYFDKAGRLQGIIQPPAAIAPRRDGHTDFNSLQPPQTGRRNNQGLEGVSLSPDGRTLFVAVQSALIQDTATGSGKADASGRTNIRVLVYDVGKTPAPAQPIAHYVMQLPAYTAEGDGAAPNRTAAQSEILGLDGHSFLMLSRDSSGRGGKDKTPIVYKSVLLVDVAGATNIVGTPYETGTTSLLQDPAKTRLKPGIVPATWVELVNMLNPPQLARFGLNVDVTSDKALSEKWEAMDLVPVLEPDHPADYFLLIGNDNDFIARHCVMDGKACDSEIDNDNRILVYRVRLPTPLR